MARILEQERTRAKELLSSKREVLDRVVKALVERLELSRKEFLKEIAVLK